MATANYNDLDNKTKEEISALFLELARVYWRSVDATARKTGLTPPLRLTTLVTDDTGQGRDTQIKIEIERINLNNSPLGVVHNG